MIKKLAIIISSILCLSGCFDSGMSQLAPSAGAPQGINGYLAEGYAHLASIEANQHRDWEDSQAFAAKSAMAARGETVLPSTPAVINTAHKSMVLKNPDYRNIPPEFVETMRNWRDKLLLDLKNGKGDPAELARRQLAFEGCLEELEEANSPSRIRSFCKNEPAYNVTFEHFEKRYVIYFKFDQYDITPKALSIIDRAVNYANETGKRIKVLSHTDKSGDTDYNQKLAANRSITTANALIARGADKNKIQFGASGELSPAIPTADDTREQYNRRSEIVVY